MTVIVIGHFCGTDETLDPGVHGALDENLVAVGFTSRQAAEEWLGTDAAGAGDWYPDAVILDVQEPRT